MFVYAYFQTDETLNLAPWGRPIPGGYNVRVVPPSSASQAVMPYTGPKVRPVAPPPPPTTTTTTTTATANPPLAAASEFFANGEFSAQRQWDPWGAAGTRTKDVRYWDQHAPPHLSRTSASRQN